MGIYEPAEDSHLLQKYVRQQAVGRVLDLGTGSGIQALTAITNPNTQLVVAVDQDSEAVKALQEKIKKEKLRKVQVRQSDLFDKVEGQFNLIIFNPPYLPQDKGITDQAIYGGKKGWEISERFFQQASGHLFPDGKILFLFSSHTHKGKIDEIIGKNLLLFTDLEQQKLAFETLYLYLIEKSLLRRELEKKGIENIQYFTHGKRGNIFTGTIDRSKFIKKHLPLRKDIVKVAIKVKRKESQAVQRMENEARWLPLLNQQGIGPRFLFHGEGYLVYEFVEGEDIVDWIKTHSKDKIQTILSQILEQAYRLDQLGMAKEELQHPQQHILITSCQQAVFLDFERAHETKTPHNVTQAAEFIGRLQQELAEKGWKTEVQEFRQAASLYHKNRDKEAFHNLLNLLQG